MTTSITSLANTRLLNAKRKLAKFTTELNSHPCYMLGSCDDQFKAAAIVEVHRVILSCNETNRITKIEENINILISNVSNKSTSTTSNLMKEKLLEEYQWWKEQLLSVDTK